MYMLMSKHYIMEINFNNILLKCNFSVLQTLHLTPTYSDKHRFIYIYNKALRTMMMMRNS